MHCRYSKRNNPQANLDIKNALKTKNTVKSFKNVRKFRKCYKNVRQRYKTKKKTHHNKIYLKQL